jgi:hypothetical protein
MQIGRKAGELDGLFVSPFLRSPAMGERIEYILGHRITREVADVWNP